MALTCKECSNFIESFKPRLQPCPVSIHLRENRCVAQIEPPFANRLNDAGQSSIHATVQDRDERHFPGLSYHVATSYGKAAPHEFSDRQVDLIPCLEKDDDTGLRGRSRNARVQPVVVVDVQSRERLSLVTGALREQIMLLVTGH